MRKLNDLIKNNLNKTIFHIQRNKDLCINIDNYNYEITIISDNLLDKIEIEELLNGKFEEFIRESENTDLFEKVINGHFPPDSTYLSIIIKDPHITMLDKKNTRGYSNTETYLIDSRKLIFEINGDYDLDLSMIECIYGKPTNIIEFANRKFIAPTNNIPMWLKDVV